VTDYEIWLIDEQIEAYRRLIASHREKILQLSRLKNKPEFAMEELGFRITKKNV